MDLDGYYQFVYTNGNLRTPEHAVHWSDGVLSTLGTALDRKTKKTLAGDLPDELARSTKDVFWLLHFRDPNLSREEFLRRAARRSGNSNSEFAFHPAVAVFAGVRYFISSETDRQVAKSLSPDLRALWEQGGALYDARSEALTKADGVMSAA